MTDRDVTSSEFEQNRADNIGKSDFVPNILVAPLAPSLQKIAAAVSIESRSVTWEEEIVLGE